MTVQDGLQGLGDVGGRIDVVQLVGCDDGGQEGPVLGADFMTGEQCVLSGEGNLPVILPMSGNMSSFTILGIRCVDVVCRATTSETVFQVRSRTWSRPRGLSRLSPPGCWTRSFAPVWRLARRVWGCRHSLICTTL